MRWLCFLMIYGGMSLGLVSNASAELSGTLKKIKDYGYITIGYREASIPFSYIDNDQKPIGYAMELCNRAVEEVKKELNMPDLKVRHLPVTSQNRIILLQNGTIDLECGSTSNNLQRQQQAGFSVTYFITSVRMCVLKNSGIRTLKDLDGKPVVTTAGTTADGLIKAREQAESFSVRMIYGKDHTDSFLMVQSGRAAAFVIDDILLAGLIANSKRPVDFEIVGPSLRDEPYGAMMRKDDPAFKAVVDRAFIRTMASGEIEKIYDRWFMNPIPPRNINVNFPLSPLLKAAYDKPNDEGVE